MLSLVSLHVDLDLLDLDCAETVLNYLCNYVFAVIPSIIESLRALQPKVAKHSTASKLQSVPPNQDTQEAVKTNKTPTVPSVAAPAPSNNASTSTAKAFGEQNDGDKDMNELTTVDEKVKEPATSSLLTVRTQLTMSQHIIG